MKVHDEPFYSIPGRLRVHLENVNESPQIELLKIPYAVQEDSPLNTVVGAIKFFDEDFQDEHTMFLLSPSSSASLSSPLDSFIGSLHPHVSSNIDPRLSFSGPEIVPLANRSPVLRLHPVIV